MEKARACDSFCRHLYVFFINIRFCLGVFKVSNVCFPRRWVFLRAGIHRELDQRQEQNQPHDQPAPADQAPHPQQGPEDGHHTVEVQSVDSSSFQLVSQNPPKRFLIIKVITVQDPLKSQIWKNNLNMRSKISWWLIRWSSYLPQLNMPANC